MQLSKMIGALGAAILLTAGPAHAQGYSWTGCHIGVMGGAAMMNVELGAGGLSVDGLGGDGWRGGLGGGCDMQLDKVVVGLFGDYHWTEADFEVTTPGPSFSAGLGDTWTVGGRAGLTVGDRALAYGLVGWSQSETDSSAGSGPDFSGWVVGGGAEMLFAQQLSGRLEYRATLYESETIGGISVQPVQHAVMVGMSWRFGPSMVGQ